MSLGYADRLKPKRNLGGQLGAQEFHQSLSDIEESVQELASWVRPASGCVQALSLLDSFTRWTLRSRSTGCRRSACIRFHRSRDIHILRHTRLQVRASFAQGKGPAKRPSRLPTMCWPVLAPSGALREYGPSGNVESLYLRTSRHSSLQGQA